MKKIKLAIGNLGVKIIRFISRRAKIDLIPIAYQENGITKSHSLKASGEEYFIYTYLKKQLTGGDIVLFDVGANVGEYSKMLSHTFPNASLYAFEPNPATFSELKNNSQDSTTLVNKGIGAFNGTMELFYSASNETSVQATSDRKILEEIARTEDIISAEIGIITLDDFCFELKIEHIDLLKIDTEGFEMEALEGASELLKRGAIRMIVFEFNEVNIIKRRFLKDYFELLHDFEFYRLDENRLIPLGDWQPKYEIFMFQNILAVRK